MSVDIYCQQKTSCQKKKYSLDHRSKNGYDSMLSALKRCNGIGHLPFPLVNTKEAQINRNKIAHNI